MNKCIPCAWPIGHRWHRTDGRSTASHPSCSTWPYRAVRTCCPDPDTPCRTSRNRAPSGWQRFVPKMQKKRSSKIVKGPVGFAAKCTYSECLVHLPRVNVAQLQTRTLQDLRNAVRRSQQQLVHGILRHVQEVAQVRLGLQTQLLGLLLGHDHAGRSAVRLKEFDFFLQFY